jgi:hypothetical protein
MVNAYNHLFLKDVTNITTSTIFVDGNFYDFRPERV